MWEISVASQFGSTVFAGIFGGGLAIQYFIVNELFGHPKSKVKAFVSDIIFWLITSFEYFIINLIFSNGKIRPILFLFSAIGFIIVHKYFRIIRIIIRKLFCNLIIIFGRITAFLQDILNKSFKIFKKIIDLFKKLLIKCAKMMYTVLGKKRRERP